MRFSRVSILFFIVGCSFLQTKLNPPVVQNFDVDNYLGNWYEIARLPNRFEKNLTHVTATYSQAQKSKIIVLNKGYHTKKKKWKEAEGKARFASRKDVGHLKVSFFGPFYADYFVLDIDQNYQYALVGGNSPHYLWILARNPELEQTILDRLIKKAQSLGYKTEDLIFIDQKGKL